ncbi:MAG: hypothetical protein ACTHOU_05275, partial [Aureliella sp.]
GSVAGVRTAGDACVPAGDGWLLVAAATGERLAFSRRAQATAGELRFKPIEPSRMRRDGAAGAC